jgi:hypothetical protein
MMYNDINNDNPAEAMTKKEDKIGESGCVHSLKSEEKKRSRGERRKRRRRVKERRKGKTTK